MTAHDQVDRIILEQSSQWIEILKRGDRSDLEAFGRWLRESRRHVRHFLMMTALDEELKYLDPECLIPVERVEQGSAEVVVLNEESPASVLQAYRLEDQACTRPPARSRFRGRQLGWWSLAVLFVFAGLVSAWMGWHSPNDWQEYATAVGEQRTVALADGSVVTLNTRSHILVRFSERRREIRMQDGEAIFKVRRDTRRPFRVYTHKSFVQAVGTQFNVYQRALDSSVYVLEGSVSVEPDDSTPEGEPKTAMSSPRNAQRISAGSQARIDTQGNIVSVGEADESSVMAWKTRHLSFEPDTPLVEIVAEFNRYNALQFRIEDTRAEKRGYFGEFEADDPSALEALLMADDALSVRHADDEVLIRSKPAIPAGLSSN